MATATFIRDVKAGFHGDARLYRLDPPLGGYDSEVSHGLVIVSAVDVMFTGPETYIFGASDDGEVIDWSELPGSFKGDLDHGEALTRAGYEVA